MIGYVIQFVAMASFGLSNCFWSSPLKRVPLFLLITIRAGLTSCFFLSLILLQSAFDINFPESFHTPADGLTLEGVLISVFICAVNYFGLVFFTKSIKAGSVSLSIPILSMGAIIGIIVGIFLYKQPFSVPKAATGVLFTFGLWFMEKMNPQMWKLRFSKAVGFSLLSTLFWSTGAFFPIGIQRVGLLNFSFILEVTVCFMSFTIFLFQRKRDHSPKISIIKKDYQSVFFLALFGFMGVFCANLAFSYLPLTILGLITIIQPIVSMVFAGYLLKERLSYIQYIGVIIILVGLWISRY
jgi:drug/metabolite transporter (DMT)-like permease